MRVDGGRLRTDLEKLATFGQETDGSVSRPAFSNADIEARKWLAGRAREAGLSACLDSMLNVLIGEESEAPSVWTGSHLDSVPEGGMFDGALGSVAALECLRRLREERVRLARPVRGVAFSDEEGAFLGFAGSKAFAGQLSGINFDTLHGPDGRSLTDAIRETGGDPQSATSGAFSSNTLDKFIELHIEQGPVLEATSTQIGVVTSIVGVGNGAVCFAGRPDHAGTTPMNLRRDAMRGAAAFLNVLPDIPASTTAVDRDWVGVSALIRAVTAASFGVCENYRNKRCRSRRRQHRRRAVEGQV